MRKLFKLMKELLKNGKDTVLVTVIASSGSTPRGAGAKMLIASEGRKYGTVGGGAVEFKCISMALDVLKDKSSRIECYSLRKNDVQDLGMICGGDVHVYFSFVPAKDASFISLAAKVEEMFINNEQSWLINEITAGYSSTIGIYGVKSGLFGIDAPNEIINNLKNKAVQLEADGKTFYCEKLVQSGTVYIFGGGHVSQALVPTLAAVDFRCTVLEDRMEFCRAELFPGVTEILLIDNKRISDYVSIGKDDYIVILTRGHKDDQAILAQALRTPARYLGVIGSRRKSKQVFLNLTEMGFSDCDFARVSTPIGIDICAETPAEIAISITAQLIRNRAGHDKPSNI